MHDSNSSKAATASQPSCQHGETGAQVAVFLSTLLMIGREGVETATMLSLAGGASDLRFLMISWLRDRMTPLQSTQRHIKGFSLTTSASLNIIFDNV
ncbi:MAG: hypothetical protein QFE16_11615 [Pseudomonadota bacterium]|nr:hypothetical protein [Pseudomonadota bacterium]